MKYLLAFDMGTTNVKGVLIDMRGTVINSWSEGMTVHSPYPNYHEQKPDDWWQAVITCSRKIAEKAGIEPGMVAGIAFTTMAMSVTMIDNNGDTLQPYSMIWRDNRASEEAAMLRRRIGGDKLSEWMLGIRVTGNYLVAKYHWFINNQPDLLKRAAAILDQCAFLCLRATGERISEWTHAASSGLFDLQTKVWSDTAFRMLGLTSIKDKFMRLVSPIEQVGKLTAEAARQMGLLEGTPVFGGALDAMTAIVGAGAPFVGDGTLIFGTSGDFAVLTNKKIRGHMGLVTTQSGDPEKLCYIGTSNSVGACMGWAAKNLYGGVSKEAFAQISEDIKKTNAGADGLIFAPWMTGERAPYHNDDIRGLFINLTVNHSREHLVRAIAEGVAFNYAVMAEAAEKQCGYKSPTIRAVGGIAKSLPWMQIFADVLNKRIETVRDPEMAGAVGAALLTAVGLGEYPTVEKAAGVIKAVQYFEPDREKHEYYKERFEKFKMIFPATVQLFHKLNSAGS